jgi:ATP-dependent protease ClpP protease subunit
LDEKTEKLLVERGVLILPEEIDHGVYELVVEATLIMRGKRFALYCRGDGGCSRSALAIVDLLRGHGDVDGLLYGEANSSHATIWAGCARRWVSPGALIGVHMVSWGSINTRMDSVTMHLIATEYRSTESRVSDVLAAASNRPADWWLKQIRETSGAVIQIPAAELIEMEMARPVGEYKKELPTLANSL